jgi:hypothetical protein
LSMPLYLTVVRGLWNLKWTEEPLICRNEHSEKVNVS